MSVKAQSGDKPDRVFYYYICKGKYENGATGKHCICEGHIFTLETRMSYCPSCGKPLEMLESATKRTDAITCVLKKCISCPNRYRSAAVNDEHCLGGDRFKNGAFQKIKGSFLCNGCLCAGCCKEIADDALVIKKYGLTAVVQAQAELKKAIRWAIQTGDDKVFDRVKTNNSLFAEMSEDMILRWLDEFYESVKREGRQSGGIIPFSGPLTKALGEIRAAG